MPATVAHGLARRRQLMRLNCPLPVDRDHAQEYSRGVSDGEPQPNQIGKRYVCAVCSLELMCVRKGAGHFTCHGQPMALVEAKPLPSSD
jgi:hypothetical protein